jgi:transglutaminase-like putative cysteine protease
MKFEITHSTTYSYLQPVAQSHHLLHLQPRQTPNQTLIHHSLLIDPAPIRRSEITDYFGNAAVLLRIEDSHLSFGVHARSTVDVTAATVPNLEATTPWERVASLGREPGALVSNSAFPGTADLAQGFDPFVLQFSCPSRQTPVSREIADFASVSFPKGRPILAGAMDLTTRIFREFTFDPTATDVSTPIARVLTLKRGVCQDFAHLALAALRALGIPARYVSGYLLTRPPVGQVKLKGTDASHAWLSVWAPETGWVDFDPTNGIIASAEHITVAYGRDYDDISPISGVLLGGGNQTIAVSVDVEAVG